MLQYISTRSQVLPHASRKKLSEGKKTLKALLWTPKCLKIYGSVLINIIYHCTLCNWETLYRANVNELDMSFLNALKTMFKNKEVKIKKFF